MCEYVSGTFVEFKTQKFITATPVQETSQLMIKAKLVLDKNQWNSWGGAEFR